MLRVFVSLLMAVMLLPQMAFADNSTLLFTRSNVSITRKNVPPIPLLPWQDKNTPPQAQDPVVNFDVEVRDGMTLYRQEGWYSLDSPGDNAGVLMLFSQPGVTPINRLPQYAPLDVLMINREGAITQIVPNLQLSTLEENIVPQSEILAFMFIKGGISEKLSIHPGDVMDYKAFRKPPVVIGGSIAPLAPKQEPAQPEVPRTVLNAPMMLETK